VDHLQGPVAGAQQGAQQGGDFIEGGLGSGEPAFGYGDVLLGGGDEPGVLVGGRDGGVSEHGGEAVLGAAEGGLGGADRVPGGLAGRDCR
jgi:hypothetical protein